MGSRKSGGLLLALSLNISPEPSLFRKCYVYVYIYILVYILWLLTFWMSNQIYQQVLNKYFQLNPDPF